MKKGFEILTSAAAHEDLIKYWKSGALRGVNLGFPMFHDLYTMSLPGVTDWTGFPQSGKSEFLLEILLNTSLFYGWRHLLYVPDVGDKNEIMAILIHKITGKTFDKRFKNHITEEEMLKDLDWLLHHFQILCKVDLKEQISPLEFWDIAAEMNTTQQKDGGIQTATIDSWKDMKHSMDGFFRDDKYLEYVLSYRNQMAEKHKMHFHTIIHPIKTDADSSGKRKPPSPFDLKGGSEWYNSGKCMITVHRPDGQKNLVDITVTKAKPKSVAKVGTTSLLFDTAVAKFYWNDENQKVFSSKEAEKPAVLSITSDDKDDDIPF